MNATVRLELHVDEAAWAAACDEQVTPQVVAEWLSELITYSRLGSAGAAELVRAAVTMAGGS